MFEIFFQADRRRSTRKHVQKENKKGQGMKKKTKKKKTQTTRAIVKIAAEPATELFEGIECVAKVFQRVTK